MTPSRVRFRLVPWWAGALAVACLGKLDERTLSTAGAGAGGFVQAGMGGSANGGAGGTCGGGLTLCEARCVATQSDPENCGTCGQRCAVGQACSEGKCGCAQNLTFCSSACVDTRSSSAHCGTCGNACGASQVCSSGACADGCKPTETQCGKDCVDASSSSTHCGDCTIACSGGKSCSGGSCLCPDAQTDCSGNCTPLATDSANCGTCGKACAAGQTCKAGLCACPAGQTLQNGACSSAGSGGSSGNGGSAGTGGASGKGGSGGASSGGTSTGGKNSGGAFTGGASSGGANTGGKSTGGTSTGGKSTGGTSTGGKSTGGTSTGGTGTGGKSTGGTSTGGTGTGGKSTGGTTGSTGCNNARTIADGSNTLVIAGNTRSYVVRSPATYDSSRAYRLVLAFHEIDTTAQQLADGGIASSPTPFYGLWELSQNTTIFVAPAGASTGGPWSGAQDILFTDTVLAVVQSGLCIDRSKVFATGFSAGARMVFGLACLRPDVFRGVALHSGFDVGNICSVGGGTMPIAFFSSHGVNDATVTYSSGVPLRDHFVSVNGCTAQSPASAPSGGHACTTYSGCSAGHPLEWCAFSGAHTPRPVDSGQTTSWMPARVWAFFTQF